jgi:hypothetical protein
MPPSRLALQHVQGFGVAQERAQAREQVSGQQAVAAAQPVHQRALIGHQLLSQLN